VAHTHTLNPQHLQRRDELDSGHDRHTTPTDDPSPTEDPAVSGAIEVNASTGRMSRVTSHVASRAGYTEPSTQTFIEFPMDQTVKYSDYGKPVPAGSPNASTT
jgi:hypothetical protein